MTALSLKWFNHSFIDRGLGRTMTVLWSFLAAVKPAKIIFLTTNLVLSLSTELWLNTNRVGWLEIRKFRIFSKLLATLAQRLDTEGHSQTTWEYVATIFWLHLVQSGITYIVLHTIYLRPYSDLMSWSFWLCKYITYMYMCSQLKLQSVTIFLLYLLKLSLWSDNRRRSRSAL